MDKRDGNALITTTQYISPKCTPPQYFHGIIIEKGIFDHKNNQIMQLRQSLFWDTDVKTVDLDKSLSN